MNRLFCLFALTIVCTSVHAFDIAIYSDARSGVNWRCQKMDSTFCWDEDPPSRATVLANIGADNEQQVFDWYHYMGVTHIIPYYPFASDFTDYLSRDLYNMKILNFSWPGEAFKYMESQNREIFVADFANRYVNDDGSSWNNDIAFDTLRQLDAQNLRVIEANSQMPDTMWLPWSELGKWNGWNWREAGISGDVFMPMYFRITCNLVSDGEPDGEQEIATFYWLVHDEDGSGWWRYPAQVLTVDSLEQGRTLSM